MARSISEIGTLVREKPVPEAGFRNQDTVNSHFASFRYHLHPFWMKLGHARVSTSEQVLDLQLDALRQAGCELVFTDTGAGVQAHKLSRERNVLVPRTYAGLAPRYQQIGPAVRKPYEAGQHSTRQIMDNFQVGSRRTLYRILRFAGCPITSPRVGSAVSAHPSPARA
ncbi:recombinase family protein [Hymenobacter aquaticus]|uniref:hypothetical protein n=1 Tax=Hymenobacter aquaticus TaxID=1867101 RepID=UPI001AEBF1DE|nr:hypothetical protein [Hymenobacter aquaticus]